MIKNFGSAVVESDSCFETLLHLEFVLLRLRALSHNFQACTYISNFHQNFLKIVTEKNLLKIPFCSIFMKLLGILIKNLAVIRNSDVYVSQTTYFFSFHLQPRPG